MVGAVRDAEGQVDFLLGAHDGLVEDDAGGAQANQARSDWLPIPWRAAHDRTRPVPDEDLKERVRVAAVGEDPRRRVVGASPRHQPVAGARLVVDPNLHAGEEGVGWVVEALPQGGAVRRPDDEVAGVQKHRRGGIAGGRRRTCTGDVSRRPKNTAVGAGQDEVGGVGQGQRRRWRSSDGGFSVGDPHDGETAGDVVVPYAEVQFVRGRRRVGGGEEAQGEAAAVGHDGGARGERLAGDEPIIGGTR